MYKGSVVICNINSVMQLRYNLMLKNDEQVNQALQKYPLPELIQVFQMGGSTYLKLHPMEYITVDIKRGNDRGAAWNSNLQINLNRYSVFEWKRKVKSMLEAFTIKELFYTYEDSLLVNAELAKEHSEKVRTPAGKVLYMTHSTVPDKNVSSVFYEGITVMINHPDSFCYVTYEELCYLYDELCQLQFSNYMVSVLLTAFYNKKNSIGVAEKGKLIVEEEQVDNSSYVPQLKKPSEIPDI